MSNLPFDVTSPATVTKSVDTSVSTATLDSGSCLRNSSNIASEIWSHTLSGCPSVTDSDEKVYVLAFVIID